MEFFEHGAIAGRESVCPSVTMLNASSMMPEWNSTYSLLRVARQPLAVLAGVDRVTVRVVAESSRREARVSKIPVPHTKQKRHQSRRDAGDEKPTHCKAALELSLKLRSPSVFKPPVFMWHSCGLMPL